MIYGEDRASISPEAQWPSVVPLSPCPVPLAAFSGADRCPSEEMEMAVNHQRTQPIKSIHRNGSTHAFGFNLRAIYAGLPRQLSSGSRHVVALCVRIALGYTTTAHTTQHSQRICYLGIFQQRRCYSQRVRRSARQRGAEFGAQAVIQNTQTK